MSNTLLLSRLASARPDDAVLSEESNDSLERLDASRVWIIDPLDGTREVGIPGREDWAVHVALWEAGDVDHRTPDREIVTAVDISLPATGLVLATDLRPVGPRTPNRSRPLILVSEIRPPSFIDELAASVGATVAPMGSAGAKAMAVLAGEADAYIHAGGQWEWDSAAPVGVARAAGLHASRLDGSPLLYNQPHPYLPDLVLCRVELANLLLSALKPYAAMAPSDPYRVCRANPK